MLEVLACPISAPPAIGVPLPWEAPLAWTAFCGVATVVLGALTLLTSRVRRRYRPSAARHTAVALLGAGLGCVLAYASVELLLYLPALDRLSAWSAGEVSAGCSSAVLELPAEPLAPVRMAMNGMFITLGWASWCLVLGSRVALFGATRHPGAERER